MTKEASHLICIFCNFMLSSGSQGGTPVHFESSDHSQTGADPGAEEPASLRDTLPNPPIPRPQPPDFTALPRAAAATIELLAEAAAIHFASRIRMAEALLEKAPNPGRYRDSIAGELAMRRAHLAEARSFETAARRRRVEPLGAEEQALLDLARERNPDATGSGLEALLRTVPTDPLAVAGIRLDAAAGAFRDYCGSAAMGDDAEAPFGRLEAALETAREAYRRLLSARTEQSAATLERRLAL
jgi:hypothetical protein